MFLTPNIVQSSCLNSGVFAGNSSVYNHSHIRPEGSLRLDAAVGMVNDICVRPAG